MKKVCVIGHFGFGKELLNGQTIKTKIVTSELERCFGNENIFKIDIFNGRKRLVSLFFETGKALKSCENVIIMPVESGLCFFSVVLKFWNCFYGRKIHYVVIGGWLPDFLSEKKWLKRMVKTYAGIYVETCAMKSALAHMGLDNIVVMPNCKELKILQTQELCMEYVEPYAACTFSRVMKEKGIENAVNAIKNINTKCGRTIFQLDIYGQIEKGQENWFEEFGATFPPYIHYKGAVPFGESTDVLRGYYVMLFPTYYDGEGFAGTLIDALAAGVPIIASDWKYNSEIVQKEKTGIIFNLEDVHGLEKALMYAAENKEKWMEMKRLCLVEAEKYLPKNALTALEKVL